MKEKLYMRKILLVTEKPNKDAEGLTHKELFDLKRNSFSQFFGRALFGKESLYRSYFNDQFIKWMHARGSKCYGKESLDGKDAIREDIKKNYELIVTFGISAAEVIFNNKITLEFLADKFKQGPAWIGSLNIEKLRFIKSSIVCFPHVSGQAQRYWKIYANSFSDCLIKTQEVIERLVNT